jgi:hypothetical protein
LQRRVSCRAFRDDQNAGGELVEAAHERRTTTIRPFAGVPEQCVHQGAAGVPIRRVNDHARQLVERQQVVVFVEHVQHGECIA